MKKECARQGGPAGLASAGSDFIPLLVVCLVAATMLLIPLKVIGYGFLPIDDALRHAAKAVSGKSWNEILVLRPGITMDSHPGWHILLSLVHRCAGVQADGLVTFSVIFLFLVFCVVPMFFLRRIEAWPLALLAISVMKPGFPMRLLKGRPYILTMAVTLVLCFLWPRLRNKRPSLVAMMSLAILIAASTWIHGSWHLFALPVICFLIAREWRAGIHVGVCVALGVLAGSSLTGHPYLFLRDTLLHTLRSFSSHQLQRTLVSEFQPFFGDAVVVIAVFLMVAWRRIRGAWDPKRIDNPVFILAASGWVLGFVAERFWVDWGMVALAVWMGQELQEAVERTVDLISWRRLFLAAAVSGTLFIATTCDYSSRWTANLSTEYLSQDDPDQAQWLPGPGGIIYSNDMSVFYQTFFKNPHAPWRYILGFEPTMMPLEDLAIYRKIQWNFGADKSFEPWVKKMAPADRLIIRGAETAPPAVAELEWHYAATGTWIGRLPEHPAKAPPAG